MWCATTVYVEIFVGIVHCENSNFFDMHFLSSNVDHDLRTIKAALNLLFVTLKYRILQ